MKRRNKDLKFKIVIPSREKYRIDSIHLVFCLTNGEIKTEKIYDIKDERRADE